MSIESQIADLIAAIDANTKAILGLGNGASNGGSKSAKADEPAKEAPAERTSRRSAREEKAPAAEGPTESELKEAVAKFLDQEATPEGDAEYERRLTKAIDPVFAKAGVKEMPDLPEKYWPEIIANIKDYEKAPAEPATRRRR